VTCKPFDVVVVPFPFTDRATVKRRPALVLSDLTRFNAVIGQSLLAMITSAQHSAWPFDTAIRDLAAAGLSAPSVVRMKLFTLDNQLIIRRAGALAARDRTPAAEALNSVLKAVIRRAR
jgi:mRNA interferase MazF